MTEMLDQTKHMTDFWRCIRFAGLGPYLKASLPDSAALITTKEVFSVFCENGFVKDTQFIDIEKIQLQGLTQEVGRAAIFAPKGELRLARQLTAQTKGCLAASLTYDILPALMKTTSRFRWALFRQNRGTYRMPDFLVVSQLGTDAEYFRLALKAAGYGHVPEGLLPFHKPLAAWQTDFSPLRFLLSLCGLATDQEKIGLHIQSDLIAHFEVLNRLNPFFLISKIQKAGIPLIRFVRRDKLFQGSLVQFLNGSRARSIWSINRDLPNLANKNVEEHNLFAAISDLIDEEIMLEHWLKPAHGKMKQLTLEDLVNAPHKVMTDMTDLIGAPGGEKESLPPYVEIFDRFPWLIEQTTRMRRAMIDRLGLHMNIEGSITTASEQFLQSQLKANRMRKISGR